MNTHGAARRIGEKASTWTRSGAAGNVLAAVTRCVYLEAADGEIVWLIPPDSPMHRRAIQVTQVPAVEPGVAVVAHDDGLHIGNTRIGLGTASRWSPRQLPRRRGGHLPGGGVAGCLMERPYGLAALLFAPSLTGSDDPMQRALGEHVAPLIGAVWDACGQRDLAGVLAAGQGLIGLGAGLTPSGDDFLGAALFALHHTGCWDADAVGSFFRQARSRTNAISFTIMADMAHGHGPEPLHDLLVAILCHEPREAVTTAASSLIRIGHSSGWDMLAGLLAGLHRDNRPASSCLLNVSEAAHGH